jgi:hypothetical protein
MDDIAELGTGQSSLHWQEGCRVTGSTAQVLPNEHGGSDAHGSSSQRAAQAS